MTKFEVRTQMLSAKTLRECSAARALQATYIEQHPEDEEFLLDASESLYMLEDGLKEAARPPAAAARAS
jgi:hypothetical protein